MTLSRPFLVRDLIAMGYGANCGLSCLVSDTSQSPDGHHDLTPSTTWKHQTWKAPDLYQIGKDVLVRVVPIVIIYRWAFGEPEMTETCKRFLRSRPMKRV